MPASRKTGPRGANESPKHKKLTISIPDVWDHQVRELAAERGEGLSDVVLSSLKIFAFLSDQRARGYRLFLSHPHEDTQREVLFMDLPDPDPALIDPPRQNTNQDAVLTQLASRLDELVASMSTEKAQAATERAIRSTGERRPRRTRTRPATAGRG